MPEKIPSVWGIHDAANPQDPRPKPSGCGYYRIVLPLQQLAANGWKAGWQAGTPPDKIGEYELIVGERLDKPQVLGAWRRLRLGHKLAYEIDDDVWSVDPANAQAHNVYSRYAVQDAVETCIITSDLVTVTCEPLAQVVRERTGHPNIKVIGNCIPAGMLELTRGRPRRVTIGWTGGVSHSWDVQLVAPAVRKVMERNPALQLHIIGSDFRATFGDVRTRMTHWLDEPASYYRAIDFDIGLAPIAVSRFNESKSFLKALEYAALGIPVVASDFGEYRNFVVDGVTGFLVKTEKQWVSRIEELVADKELRENMGAKARELAAQHTIEGNWHRWAAAYEEILR